MAVVVAEATREEFGLWYEEQAGTRHQRLLCAFAAEVHAARPVWPDEVAGALVRVLDRHPECRSTFDADDDGRLVKTSGHQAADIAVLGSDRTVTGAVAALAAEPLSVTAGPVLRLGMRLDRAGAVEHVVGVAHHVVWDGRSEDIFWAALEQELPTGPVRAPDRTGRPRWYAHRGPGAPTAHERDPQWRAEVPTEVWRGAREHARELGTTEFTWLVGHLAAGVAAWVGGPVTPYVDIDLRAVDRAARERIGYFQAQRGLRPVEVGKSGADAARQVLADLVELAAPTATTVAPEREVSSDASRACKFYVRRPRPAGGRGALCPVDVAVPTARNDLAVGLTAAGARTHLTVTARDGLVAPAALARLGRGLSGLLADTARGPARGNEE